MHRVTAFASSLVLATVLAACGSNATKPDAAPAAATTKAAPTTGAAAPEGQKIEGVVLTPGVIDIAKKEGKVELAEDDRVRCEKYKPIGSNRTQKRCYTVAEKKKTEEDNAELMRKMTAPPPSANGSIGR